MSLGLDGLIKLYSDEGEEKQTACANGMILNGCIMPSLQDYFLVSTVNEETEENTV